MNYHHDPECFSLSSKTSLATLVVAMTPTMFDNQYKSMCCRVTTVVCLHCYEWHAYSVSLKL